MASGGVTEIVWHFAGYLQIINDIARDRIEYDEGVFRRLQDDYVTPRPVYSSTPDLEQLHSRGVGLADQPAFEEFRAPRVLPIKSLSPNPPLNDSDFDSPGVPRFSFPPAGGGGGFAGVEYKISVHYQDGGEQTQLDIRQHNFMLDNDSLLVLPEGASLAFDTTLITDHTKAALQRMAEDANNEIPQEWWIPQTSEGAAEFLKTHDEEMVARGDTPAPHSVEPGYYLNGELKNPPPELPNATPDIETEPDFGNGRGQWTEAGTNDSFNAALIVDLGEASRSMIVMGDYFMTNAIFQTNSLIDNDDISVVGGGDHTVATGDNQTDNIANFVRNPGIHAELPTIFAGLNWNVDVVEGDFYSLHALVQTNYLIDNDIIVQNNSQVHSEVYGGWNVLGNVAQAFDGTIKYDLIIVEGAYHGVNVIFQNNILLNSDAIRLIAEGIDPQQSVQSGGNKLTNSATIEAYGDDNFKPMNDGLSLILDAISKGTTSLDPSYGTLIDGTGGTFDVLYVKGDYYDVNAIWQTNVTADMNVIIQMIGAAEVPEYFVGGDATQSVTSGMDSLTNDAAIIDVGATNTFVNGDVYGETILVQANLLPTDEDQALAHDIHTLVPELIAFVNESEAETQVAPVTPTSATHDDPMATVLN